MPHIEDVYQADQSVTRQVIEAARMVGSLVKSRTLVYVFAMTSLITFLTTLQNIPDPSIVVRLIASSYLVSLAAYLYNDLTDYKVDKANERKIAYDNSKKKYLITLYSTTAFFVISISLAFSINIATGIAALVFTALGIVYSHPKTAFKEKYTLKTPTRAAGAVVVAMMGAFAAESYTTLAFASYGLALLSSWILGPMGDIGDIKGDRAGGRRTIPIMIGIPKTFLLIGLIVVGMGIVSAVAFYYLNLHIMGLAFVAFACTVALLQINKISKNYENKTKVKHTRTILRYSLLAIEASILIGMAKPFILF